MDTVEVRVARGAEWLDAVYPEWWTRVDLGSLDLSDGCRCVLGQMAWLVGDTPMKNGYGRFRRVGEKAGINTARWVHHNGFNDDDYAALDEAWISEIKARWERGL